MRDGDAQVFLLAMQSRLHADPRLALSLTPSASAADVRTAFLTLTKQYHPVKFARCDAAVQRLANEVFLLLREAHDVVAKTARTAVGTTGRSNVVGSASTTGPLRTVVATRTTGPSPVVGRTPTPQLAATVALPRTVNPAAAKTQSPAPTVPSASAATSVAKPAAASSVQPASAAGKTLPAAAPQRPTTTVPPIAPGKPGLPAPASVSFGSARRAPPLAAPSIAPTVVDETELFTKGKELLRQKNWHDARDAFVALTRRNKLEPAYQAMLALARGRIDQANNNLEGARTQFSLALQLEPAFTAAATALDEIGPVESKSSLWSKLRGK